VPAAALALALAAAVVHAGWNVLAAREERTEAAVAVALLAGSALAAPFAIATWEVDKQALPFAGASIALELGYMAALAAAYARGPLSFTYPVARGLAPILVLALAPVVGAVPGVLAIAAGVVLLARRDDRIDRRQVALTLAVAACIAGYTVVDDRALLHADPLPYLWLILTPTAVLYALAIGARRVREAISPGAIVAGIGMYAAYGLTLAALDRADPAPVAAVRETSVVLGTLLAGVVLNERVGPRTVAGAILVTAGVALLT
jgi:drug/metabolite transporter (DMT)-like permease